MSISCSKKKISKTTNKYIWNLELSIFINLLIKFNEAKNKIVKKHNFSLPEIITNFPPIKNQRILRSLN